MKESSTLIPATVPENNQEGLPRILNAYYRHLDPCVPHPDNVYAILAPLLPNYFEDASAFVSVEYETQAIAPQWNDQARLRGRLMGWLKLVSLSVPVLPLPTSQPLVTTMDILKGALNARNPIKEIVKDGERGERWMQMGRNDLEGWLGMLKKKRKKQLTKCCLSILSNLLPHESPPSLMTSILLASMHYTLDVPTVSPSIQSLVNETVDRVLSQLETDMKSKGNVDKGFFAPGSPFTSLYDERGRVMEVFAVHIKNLFKYAEENEADLVWECRIERMVGRGVDGGVRRYLKELEPGSAKELQLSIDSCKAALSSITLPPTDESQKSGDDVRQAMKDLKREKIFVNGVEVVNRVLSNKRELVDVIKSALQNGVVEEKRRRKTRVKEERLSDISTSSDLSASDLSESDSPYPSSDTSNGAYSTDESDSGRRNRRNPPPRPIARPRKFDTSKLEEIVTRVLLAASRTFSGGDMLAVIQDLFGCEGVVIKPSPIQTGTIHVNVSVSAVSVVCKMYTEVVDLKAVEEEGTNGIVMYIYGKTEERIELRIVRKEGGGEGEVMLIEKEKGEKEGSSEFGRVMKIKVKVEGTDEE